jgi:hypothetical protein
MLKCDIQICIDRQQDTPKPWYFTLLYVYNMVTKASDIICMCIPTNNN